MLFPSFHLDIAMGKVRVKQFGKRGSFLHNIFLFLVFTSKVMMKKADGGRVLFFFFFFYCSMMAFLPTPVLLLISLGQMAATMALLLLLLLFHFKPGSLWRGRAGCMYNKQKKIKYMGFWFLVFGSDC